MREISSVEESSKKLIKGAFDPGTFSMAKPHDSHSHDYARCIVDNVASSNPQTDWKSLT